MASTRLVFAFENLNCTAAEAVEAAVPWGESFRKRYFMVVLLPYFNRENSVSYVVIIATIATLTMS